MPTSAAWTWRLLEAWAHSTAVPTMAVAAAAEAEGLPTLVTLKGMHRVEAAAAEGAVR